LSRQFVRAQFVSAQFVSAQVVPAWQSAKKPGLEKLRLEEETLRRKEANRAPRLQEGPLARLHPLPARCLSAQAGGFGNQYDRYRQQRSSWLRPQPCLPLASPA